MVWLYYTQQLELSSRDKELDEDLTVQDQGQTFARAATMDQNNE